MAANNAISISFQIKDGANGIKMLTLQAEDLRKVMTATVSEAEKLNKNFINFAAFSTGLNSISDTISSLKSVMGDLSAAYAVQEEAETKLAVGCKKFAPQALYTRPRRAAFNLTLSDSVCGVG